MRAFLTAALVAAIVSVSMSAQASAPYYDAEAYVEGTL